MGPTEEPSRTEATGKVGLHMEQLPEKGYKRQPSSSAAMAVLWTLLLVIVSVGILVCLTLGRLPWDIQWLENGRMGFVVSETLLQLHDEMAGVVLVALCALLVIADRGVGKNRLTSSTTDTRHAIDWERFDNTGQEGCSSLQDVQQQTLIINELGEELAEQSRSERIIDLDAVNVCAPASDYQRKSHADAQLRIATDELSRVRRELIACRQQLDAKNKVQTEFVGSMSRELRMPISGIAGMADLLLGGDLAAREERLARSIVATSSSLLLSIDNHLDFTKIESGRMQLDNREFSLKECIEDVCSSLISTAQDKNIKLSCYVDESTPAQMEGDSARVTQVVHKLITNAISSTHEGEVVVRVSCIECSEGRSVYQCDVQDTGVGISPETQMELFEAITQAKQTNVQDRSAAGMGLKISAELVAMMNGELSFKSRLGEGTRFSFTMELADIAASADQESTHPAQTVTLTPSRRQKSSSASAQNLSVLLVEDNPVNQSVAIGMLKQLGCDVALAVDGEYAVTMAGQDKYDIVLMDCQMPNMDGYEATRLIKFDGALNSLTPVIALTTNALDGDREKCLACGMDDYVCKPVEPEVLFHVLQKWIGLPDDRLTDNTPRVLDLLLSTGTNPDSIEPRLSSVDIDLGEIEEVRGVSNVAPINLKAIDTIRGLQRVGKDDLLTKVVGVYFDRTPELIDTMELCAREAEFEGLSACAHSLKSSSAYLGAESISKACQLIEAAVRDEDNAEATKLVSGLRGEYERVFGVLDSLVKAA